MAYSSPCLDQNKSPLFSKLPLEVLCDILKGLLLYPRYIQVPRYTNYFGPDWAIPVHELSAQLLRTCQRLNAEGTRILYGSNGVRLWTSSIWQEELRNRTYRQPKQHLLLTNPRNFPMRRWAQDFVNLQAHEMLLKFGRFEVHMSIGMTLPKMSASDARFFMEAVTGILQELRPYTGKKDLLLRVRYTLSEEERQDQKLLQRFYSTLEMIRCTRFRLEEDYGKHEVKLTSETEGLRQHASMLIESNQAVYDFWPIFLEVRRTLILGEQPPKDLLDDLMEAAVHMDLDDFDEVLAEIRKWICQKVALWSSAARIPRLRMDSAFLSEDLLKCLTN